MQWGWYVSLLGAAMGGRPRPDTAGPPSPEPATVDVEAQLC
ncbi:hypothetical protein [Streptomyces chartreusis]